MKKVALVTSRGFVIARSKGKTSIYARVGTRYFKCEVKVLAKKKPKVTPTATPTPTVTPEPTATPTPEPTATPIPTALRFPGIRPIRIQNQQIRSLHKSTRMSQPILITQMTIMSQPTTMSQPIAIPIPASIFCSDSIIYKRNKKY